jgi:hypothetical protein
VQELRIKTNKRIKASRIIANRLAAKHEGLLGGFKEKSYTRAMNTRPKTSTKIQAFQGKTSRKRD